MTSHGPTKRFANQKKVVKVNKQFIADDQAKFTVCLFNQTTCWHTFYKTNANLKYKTFLIIIKKCVYKKMFF